MIPILDLKQQYLDLKSELDAAIQEVCASGNYILGPNVKALESDLAAYCDCKFGVGVANGTDALHLALRALKIGPGDEVITTPFTFIATTEAIGLVGAKPVFVDVDPDTFNIDPNLLEAAITPRTTAILPVHLYGQPCDMDPIMAIARRHNLRVVEDCAQAIGATYSPRSALNPEPGHLSLRSGAPKGAAASLTRNPEPGTRNPELPRKVGSFGDLGCLSFFPSKNLGCFGDGGMVVTNDKDLADRVEMLRRHGGKVKYRHSELGLNSRLDELQAAILRVKLKHLEQWINARRRIAYRYNEMLKDVPGISTPKEVPNVRAVYHQYTIKVLDLEPGTIPNSPRDSLQSSFKDRGVQTMVYYPVPLHLQEVHADLGLGPGSFPSAELAAETCLSLPMFPELAEAQQSRTVDSLRSCIL